MYENFECELMIIGGYSNYSVTSSGFIVNNITGNVLSESFNRGGYKTVCMKADNGNRVSRTVHRLVAEAFCPNPNRYSRVEHINGDKNDNRASNLCWVPSETEQKRALLYSTPVRIVETGAVFASVEECADFLHAKPHYVRICLEMPSCRVKGYHIELAN